MIIDSLQLIFLHIPRTGGTSVEEFFSSMFPDLGIPLSATTPANQLIKQIGIEKWRKYHKFTIVRNPFARSLSSYMFSVLRRNNSLDDIIHNRTAEVPNAKEGFSDFLKKTHELAVSVGRLNDLQVNWIKAGGRFVDDPLFMSNYVPGTLVVDRVMRFENLTEDFAALLRDFGIPNQELPHLSKTAHDPYQQYYTSEEIETFRLDYKEDLEEFGYDFDPVV